MARDVQPGDPARLAAGGHLSMTLLQPSFRGRLRLFFAVIVVVPMIAVGVALFFLLNAGDNSKFNSELGEAQTVAQNLFAGRAQRRDGRGADDAGRRRARDGHQNQGQGGGAAAARRARGRDRRAVDRARRGRARDVPDGLPAGGRALAGPVAGQREAQDRADHAVGHVGERSTWSQSRRRITEVGTRIDRARPGAGVVLADRGERQHARTARAWTSRSPGATTARRRSSSPSPTGSGTRSGCSRRCRRTGARRRSS